MLASRECLLMFGTVLMLQQNGAQEPADLTQSPSTDTPMHEVSAVCNKDQVKHLGGQMLSEFREMLSLLNRVTDRKTADQAAVTLCGKLERLNAMLRELERLPFTDEEEAQTIHADMSELTHISQNCLEIMQKLSEMGAYGSEPLMAFFSQFKIGENRSAVPQADDMPHGQLCNKLADAIEDALYALRKVHNETSARDGAHTVEDMMDVIEHTKEMLSQLDPPRTEEQRDALQPLRERLQRISDEVRKVSEQLQKENYYNMSDLEAVVKKLVRATVY